METIRDLWNSLRIGLLDRLSNPLLGAFCVAWSVWNFRIVVAILGNGDWREKIEYIDKKLMLTTQDWLFHAYVIPLALAAVYVFLLPPLLRKVTVFHREQAAITARAVMIADGEQPISEAEASKLLARLRAFNDQWDEERTTYLREIDDLRSRLASASESAPPASSESSDSASVPPPASPTDVGNHHEENNPAVASILSQLAITSPHSDKWPIALSPSDFALLPSSVVEKVRSHKFDFREIQALLAMRNWPRVQPRQLANALDVEEFDARVILDRFFNLSLMTHGVDGLSLNADGRMLTAYFKKILVDTKSSEKSSKS
jgi:hypothetical protein